MIGLKCNKSEITDEENDNKPILSILQYRFPFVPSRETTKFFGIVPQDSFKYIFYFILVKQQ